MAQSTWSVCRGAQVLPLQFPIQGSQMEGGVNPREPLLIWVGNTGLNGPVEQEACDKHVNICWSLRRLCSNGAATIKHWLCDKKAKDLCMPTSTCMSLKTNKTGRCPLNMDWRGGEIAKDRRAGAVRLQSYATYMGVNTTVFWANMHRMELCIYACFRKALMKMLCSEIHPKASSPNPHPRIILDFAGADFQIIMLRITSLVLTKTQWETQDLFMGKEKQTDGARDS